MAGRSIVQVYIIFTLCGTGGSVQHENCTDENIETIGDGYCTVDNNNEGCMYDGGDCCQCTSIDEGSSSSDSSSSYFLCVDPSSPCYSPTAVSLQSNCINGTINWIQDGSCDEENNNDGCMFDGGDCCECTSIDDGYSSSDTSSSSLLCVDPSSPCYSPTAVHLQSNCADRDIADIGNGWCDEENNNEGCLFDGGDCCSCASVNDRLEDECGSSGFKCLDLHLEPYIYDKSQHTLTACAGVQREWIVENASHVRALAEAVRCSGGSFNVTWKGKISVEKTISIFDGTILNLTSINSDSAIDGDGNIRLFSVVNASLHLSNITVSNGNAAYGGAIAASCSRASFTMVSFIGNIATNDGGALHLSNGTSVLFVGDTTFVNNTASNGGALFVVDNSNASWIRNTYFSYNVATSNGGALYLMGYSSAVWKEKAHFLHNSAGDDGGALYLTDSSSAVWTAETHFHNNSAGDDGGALFLKDNSSAVWTQDTHSLHKSAEYDGGALYLWDSSSAVWAAEAHFLNNSAGDDGGALFLKDNSSAIWTQDTHFLHNSAEYDGGALYLWQSSSAVWTAETHFLNNSAGDDGGALYMDYRCSANWIQDTHFLHNSAEYDGGAFYLWDSSSVVWTAEAHFLHNSAGDDGGALFLKDNSSAVWTAETHFLNNSAGDDGGALYMDYRCSANWIQDTHFLHNSAEYDGGALYLWDSSSVVWTAEAHFLHNSAGDDGGALFLKDNSSAVWTQDTHFLHNSAEYDGGALYLWDSSSVVWTAEAHFLHNSAGDDGGALFLKDNSSAVWTQDTHFLHNSAWSYGGALYLDYRCSASWTQDTHFLHNSAWGDGGALYLWDSSSAVWAAEAHFLNNSAGDDGGALFLKDNSSAVWTQDTHFLHNSAEYDGGALYLWESSSAVWTAEAHFLNNSAGDDGGALYLDYRSSANWTQDTHFLHNSAWGYGGALYLTNSSSAGWNAEVHFLHNSAEYDGGALYLWDSSSTVWTAEAHFLHNRAGDDGGALLLKDNSSAVWTQDTHFLHNSAWSYGGALYLDYRCSASWTQETHFLNNSAGGRGGALYLTHSSSAVWTAEAHFLNNSAGGRGGALYLWDNSSAFWTAEAHFLHSSAGSSGGALQLQDSSSAVWTAKAHFLNNSAGLVGAALCLTSSSATWIAEAHFLHNSAVYDGGALYLYRSCAFWTAGAHFLNNSAGVYGGALLLRSSSAAWTAGAHFLNNSAEDDGGALYLTYGNNTSWEGNTISSENASTGGRGGANWTAGCIFSGNNALSNGGAVCAFDGSSLSWGVKTLFVDNAAKNGGALFLSNGVNTQWSEETSFASNYARFDGGAVAHWSAKDERSIIAINGTTSFVDNKCGVNGGGMSLVHSVAIVLGTRDIIFKKNYAGASGGAVHTASNGIGIVFMEVAFVENVAQIGGGVHSTGSGNDVTVDKGHAQMNNPMTFDRCKFVGNYAFATGGAVDSASGQDVFVGTSFNGNKARVGGALRLAGIASIDYCSFEENVSELGEGPAVSNSGYMSNVTNSYFDHNVFKCKAQAFLRFDELDDPFETVCNGCPSSCFECSFGGQGSPTCMSLPEAGMEHATSKGGYTTVEEVLIQKGYWRATNTSTNILRCFNTKACQGGLTGESDYCALGYEGPYCSVCSKNYVSTLRFTCRECSDRTAVIATATVLLALALVVAIAIVSYLVSTEVVGDRQGIVDHVMERVPLHSVKIIINVWQILTQFTFVANVNFPNVYQKFLDGVNFLNFDISWVLSTGCLVEVDFHDRLLWTTISPLVIMGLLGLTYTISLRRSLGSSETSIRNTQHKHVSIALLVTFLVYSSVSSVVFQMFACEDLDDDKRYLRADYTIECDSSKHRALQMYSGFMIMLYPVGIPALYASLLFRNSEFLGDDHALEESPVIRSISSLWKAYKPNRFYYEVIECARRISLTGVIVFIYPNSAAQVAVTFAIAVVFIFVSEGMAPYESPWDAWMSRISQVIIFASMYLALLLKVNVSGENDASQNMFEVILVACHGCMVLAVIVQIVIMILSLRAGKQQEDPRPRLRRPLNSTLAIQPCLVEENDISKEEQSWHVTSSRNLGTSVF